MENLREQFAEIYDQQIEKIYRFVYLKVNSEEIAQDITSNVFLRGWEFYVKNKGKISNPSAFLYQTAKNLIVDYYRQKEKETVVVLPQNLSHLSLDENKNPYFKVVLSEEVKRLKSALNQLEPDYQDVIIWRYLDEMSISEISQISGKSEPAIRTMLHRGLKKLRELINEL